MYDIPLRNMPGGAILVWRWRDAPLAARELSRLGGEEDWVAIIPPAAVDPDPVWMREGGPFGVCSVERHTLITGHTVAIGAHA